MCWYPFCGALILLLLPCFSILSQACPTFATSSFDHHAQQPKSPFFHCTLNKLACLCYIFFSVALLVFDLTSNFPQVYIPHSHYLPNKQINKQTTTLRLSPSQLSPSDPRINKPGYYMHTCIPPTPPRREPNQNPPKKK